MEHEVIRISVRNLVEFVMRSGDLDNRRMSGAEKDAMQAGSRIHRKIQKRMGAGYRAEVPLKHEMIMGYYMLSVEGRADGIFWRCQTAKKTEEGFSGGISVAPWSRRSIRPGSVSPARSSAAAASR